MTVHSFSPITILVTYNKSFNKNFHKLATFNKSCNGQYIILQLISKTMNLVFAAWLSNFVFDFCLEYRRPSARVSPVQCRVFHTPQFGSHTACYCTLPIPQASPSVPGPLGHPWGDDCPIIPVKYGIDELVWSPISHRDVKSLDMIGTTFRSLWALNYLHGYDKKSSCRPAWNPVMPCCNPWLYPGSWESLGCQLSMS